MSDVMHGPSVVVGERVKRKTYLIAFIDDATRVIPHAAFALSENTRSFLPVLKLAIEKRGLPQRLYVDNGANYRSRHLALVCAKLGIALIHARPYRPQGKGKIERWFKTVRAQCSRACAEDTASLEALNRRLGAGSRASITTAPTAAWTAPRRWSSGRDRRGGALPGAGAGSGRCVPVRGRAQGAEGPHREPQRRRLRGRCRVGRREGDAALRSRRTARASRAGLSRGQAIELARPVQTYANCFVKRDRPSWTLTPMSPAPQPAPSALRLRELPDALSTRRGGRLMYRKHFRPHRLPLRSDARARCLFASASLAEAEARLKHLLELRGIGLVTGEAGSGKTTVCRKVAAALHPGLYRVFYVPLSTGNVMDMYKSIGWELGLPTERNRASAFRVIRGEITRLTLEAKQRPVLIVDEAHHLRNEVLEDLRLLTNYRMDSENRLCLLLVGLTELRRRSGDGGA
jgi:type II secretory pathway predicted ATPase ExeA/transposase InsO family protein